MIRAVCKTNWDEFKAKAWPTAFAAMPKVGDLVQEQAPLGQRGVLARIVEITHCQESRGDTWLWIELHLPTALRSSSVSGGSDGK